MLNHTCVVSWVVRNGKCYDMQGHDGHPMFANYVYGNEGTCSTWPRPYRKGCCELRHLQATAEAKGSATLVITGPHCV